MDKIIPRFQQLVVPEFAVELRENIRTEEAHFWLRSRNLFIGSQLSHIPLLIRYNHDCLRKEQVVLQLSRRRIVKRANTPRAKERYTEERYTEYLFYDINDATLFKLFFG